MNHELGMKLDNLDLNLSGLNVNEGRRAISKMIAKLQKAIINPALQLEVWNNKQQVLQDSIDGTHEGALERPPSETPTMPNSLCHEEERIKLVNPLAKTFRPRRQEEPMHHVL